MASRGGVRPGAGRKKGVPNKLTSDVAERLAALGCDPIAGMANMAMDEDAPREIRLRAYAELAQYTAPKRKAVDMSSSDGSVSTGPHEIIVRVVKPGSED